MTISKKYLERFDTPETLIILSSFPRKRGELAIENALARYTYLLVKNFSENQRIVVLSEKRTKSERAYLLKSNILVIPSFSKNSLKFAFDVEKDLSRFVLAKNLLVQFEFSVFGGKRVIPGVCAVLALEKLRGRYISTMLHQVVKDLSPLSGHLGIKKEGLVTKLLSGFLSVFYRLVGTLSDKVIVHDNLLKTRLGEFTAQEKIEVVWHGIDAPRRFTARFIKKSREHFGFKNDEKIVTIFGYRSWYKGTDWAVKTIGQLSKDNPRRKIKLFLAGGESPTLIKTSAYSIFSGKLSRILSQNKKVLFEPGFIPEKDVPKVFAASDVVVFPYRTKMSASGALSLALQYGKPFLLSKSLSQGAGSDFFGALNKYGVKKSQVSFNMDKESVEKALFETLSNKEFRKSLQKVGHEVARGRSWAAAANKYNEIAIRPRTVRASAYVSYATE